MVCAIERFKPLAQSIVVSEEWQENMANFEELWTNAAQLINDTKEKEDEVDDRIDNLELSVGGDFSQINLRLDTLEAETAGLFTATAALDLRVTNNEGDIASANLLIQTNATDIGNQATALAALTVDVTSNTGNLAAANLQISANTSSILGNTTAIASLGTRVTTAEGNIATASLDISSNASNIGINATAIATLTTRVDGIDGSIAQAQLDISSNTTTITNLSGDVLTNTTALASLTAQVNTNTTDIAAIAGLDLTALQLQVTTNTGDIVTNTAAIANLGTSVTSLQGDVSTAELNITSNATDITTVEGDIITINGSIATLTSTANTANANASAALGASASNTLDINNAESDINDLEAEAYLVVSTTVGGFTRIAGVKATANSSTNNLAFVGDTMEWVDGAFNTALEFNTAADDFIFRKGLTSTAGTSVDFGSVSDTSNAYFSTEFGPAGSLSAGTRWKYGVNFDAGFDASSGNAEFTCTNDIDIVSGSGSSDVINLRHGISSVVAEFGQSAGINRLYVPNGYGFFTRSTSTTSSAPLHSAQLGTGSIATFRSGTEANLVSRIDNGGAFINSSTLRNKNVIERVTDTLDDLCLIVQNGMIRYTDINTAGLNIQVGLAAEEIDPIFSELCDYDDMGLPAGTDYARFTAPILVALKQIRDRLNILENP